jgi:hypothetical protein
VLDETRITQCANRYLRTQVVLILQVDESTRIIPLWSAVVIFLSNGFLRIVEFMVHTAVDTNSVFGI